MGVNQLQITDIYSILNDIHQQATGQASIAPVDTNEFVSMATSTLAAGTDAAYGAMMDVIGQTVFAVRPYSRKFDITRTASEFGAIRRKISFVDKPIQSGEQAFHPVDGASVDMYTINKQDVLEMRFYGSAVYQDSDTTFEDQIKTAFAGPEELGSFLTAKVTHLSNKWEQWLEEQNRAAVANFIGAKNASTNGLIHLLTEYNTLTGASPALTAQDIYKPTIMPDFFRFVRARINTISRLMSERSVNFQVNITGKEVTRHTPVDMQKMYINANALDLIDAMVNTITYHDEPLAYADVEGVSYWQSINSPDQINVTPSVMGSNGAVAKGAAQNVTDIFGVIFDKDAIASNVYLYNVANTPFNARGRYYNTWLTARLQYTNDLTEKGAILLLD